jgi:Small subunit of serine palmitoyltransferase-like
MPDYGHGIKEQDKASTSYYAGFRRWLQIKKYQYEVTFSLYMLTPTEKLVFSTPSLCFEYTLSKGCNINWNLQMS